MFSLLVWIGVVLAVAAVVLVIAGASSGEAGGLRGFGQDLAAGLRGWRSRGITSPIAPAGPQPVNATIDELFAAAELDGDAYLQVDDLTETLTWARDQAGRATRAGRVVANRSVSAVRR